jgi:hypothetical protein
MHPLASSPLSQKADTCVNLGNGVGFTAGIGSFSTRDGDALDVLVSFRQKSGRKEMEMYEANLLSLRKDLSGDVSSIPKFCCAWKQTANHDVEAIKSAFLDAQREVFDKAAWNPTVDLAAKLGESGKSNLIIAHLYDAVLTQGLGEGMLMTI